MVRTLIALLKRMGPNPVLMSACGGELRKNPECAAILATVQLSAIIRQNPHKFRLIEGPKGGTDAVELVVKKPATTGPKVCLNQISLSMFIYCSPQPKDSAKAFKSVLPKAMKALKDTFLLPVEYNLKCVLKRYETEMY